MIGQELGKYVIWELLGKGGMGKIYRAVHPTLDRDVAIKLIELDFTGDPTVVGRFRREAQVIAALRHPGIIQVYDFDAVDDKLYMVMEYVPGESLAQRLTGIHVLGQQLPLSEALRLFRAITAAVAYAHRRGVVHCDLKPGNVLLSTDEQPILTDFGISKFISGERITVTGDILGTPHYMAPEQAAGGEVGPHTDVYALGVILYELTTGVLPFKGETSMSIVFRHVHEPPPPPRSVNANLPESVEQIILKAMAKAPAERFRTASELLAAIDGLKVAGFAPDLGRTPACFFICFQPHSRLDETLAHYLRDALVELGHTVCLDTRQRAEVGALPPDQTERQIQTSDVFVVLLSDSAVNSEMVKSEVMQAYQAQKQNSSPKIVPVRVAYDGLLPYIMPALEQPVQYIEWRSEADNDEVVQSILRTTGNGLPQSLASARVSAAFETSFISEDGWLLSPDQTSSPPLPAFDPRFVKELSVPGGAVKQRDKFYIERPADFQLKEQIILPGTTTTIRAPRQTGKTSLLMRGINYARRHGTDVVFLDFQSFGREYLSSPDLFLQELAHTICDELNLDESEVDKAWQGGRSPAKKLTRYLEKYVLPTTEAPVVLAMDEADTLLQTDFYKEFFGLLRSWHNRRASREIWENLNMVLVISTEPYLLIDDIHQSPFNVGLHLGLSDFDEALVGNLNFRHGTPLTDSEISLLMDLLNGHPYLTRLALYKLVADGLSWSELSHLAPTDDGPFGDHLRHQYWILHDKPDLKTALAQIISEQCCPDEQSLFRLLQAGLIKGSGDAYRCRCDLYRQYFADKLL